MNRLAPRIFTRNVLIALAGAVITAATACGTSTSADQGSPSAATTLASTSATTSPSPARPAPAADPQSACTALGGTVDNGQVCQVHTAGSGYEVSFTFPVDYPDQQTLTDYLTNRREDFIGFAAERPHVRPYELDAKADAYSSANTKSLVFEQYSDSGGAHPVTIYKAFTYDLAKRAPITFDTLFKPGAVEVLDPIIQREWQELSDDYGALGENTLGAKMYQDFAITDDAVIFFISQGMWLPQVAGPRQVSVPRSELASILA